MKVVITGASSGIGKAIYDWFRYFPPTTTSYEPIGVSRRGPDIECDLRHCSSRMECFSVLENYRIGGLINNAGIMVSECSLSLMRDLRDMVEVNLTSVYDFMYMLKDDIVEGGFIINIASISGVTGEADIPLYAATKAGVINLTQSFAKILAPRKIRVNSISPGFISGTELGEDEVPSELINEIPLKKEGSTRHIVGAVNYLITAKYVTGINLIVDGGLSIR